MSKSDGARDGRDTLANPVAALNALDLAFASQEMESELREALREFLPLLDGVRKLCGDIEEQPADVVAKRLPAIAMLAELAERAAKHVGLERDNCLGQRIDRDRHEVAETVIDPAAAPGTVVQVIEEGWGYDGRPVRRARVVVARQEEQK